MRFERLRLSEFKCYAETDLELRGGVTVIHGVNGSGKSSLLEACFFALYGAAAIDGTLDDVIANDADAMTVELWFGHDGDAYRVEREVRRRGDTAQTTTCVLETPDGPVEGVTDVDDRIEAILRMDAEAFVNCAYVRQGEVNKLINASPSERQDMIDDLLQLGTLETYRERASDARVGVGRVRDDRQGSLREVRERIEDKEDEDLHERLNARETELERVVADIEEKLENRDAARETLESAESVLEEYEERRSEIESLQADVAELAETISETESEREAIGERIRSLRERAADRRTELSEAVEETELEAADAETLAARRTELAEALETVRDRIEEHRIEVETHESEAAGERERAEERRERAEEARAEAEELEETIASARGKREERREALEELEAELESRRETLASASIDREDVRNHRDHVEEDLTAAREHVAELRTELENARTVVEEAEALLAAGKCPECGQPVEGAPHVESIEADRERVRTLEEDLELATRAIEHLEAKRERAVELVEAAEALDRLEERRTDVESLLEQQAETIAEKADRVEALREAATDTEADAETALEAAEAAVDAAEAARETLEDLTDERAALEDRRDRLDRVEALLDAREELEEEIDTLRERRESLAAVNDERRERLADKRERKADLESSFDEAALESARADRERAREYLDDVERYLEDRRERRDELQSAIGALENELAELEALRERREELETTVDRLSSLYEEAAELQRTYGDLRAELRKRNVETLEAMLNETFQLVYDNDSYARIELDDDYALTVYQKDGTPLQPEQLSGGERALFNLSLRCAIYRLLSEGIEGSAPTPPLILDEPTVFLDAGHVTRLVELVESMTEHGVGQIVVVSHDEELVGAADDLVAVRKNPTTNRSTAERTGTIRAPT